MEKKRLKDRVAVVTGGGKGIGRSIALAFADEGASIVVCCRTTATLEEVSREARQRGVPCIPIRADVSVEADVEGMVEQVVKALGKIDILVNNAGVPGPLNLITDITTEAWNETIGTNLTGMYLCSRAVLKYMMIRRSGNIINLSSGAGQRGPRRIRSLPYTVSKFGVEGLNKALSWQMKPYGICVNALNPGRMNTDLHRYSPPESKTDMRPPDDIKRLAVFLALQTVDTMTGESIALREWEQGKT